MIQNETDFSIENVLAKSDGTPLLFHSKMVAAFAEAFAMLTIAENLNNERKLQLLKKVKISGYLHDIGKVVFIFQEILQGKKISAKQQPHYSHNEIGWALVFKYLNLSAEEVNHIAYVVYWHHGISNKMNTDSAITILNEISQDDVELALEFIRQTLGNEFVLDLENIDAELLEKKTILLDTKTPKCYYDDENLHHNHERTFLRTCVIAADRIVSGLHETKALLDTFIDDRGEIKQDDIIRYIKSITLRQDNIQINNVPEEYDEVRFNLQKEIVQKTNKTTVINGPGGLGKTLIGLLWNIEHEKKLIWVCPRNVIAESVYSTITKEIKAFNIELSVELYLTGQVKKSNYNHKKGFNSDIIITNIDNFLKPTVDNRNAERMCFINNCDVVFDEYHELVHKDNALFGCFINMMLTRNRITNSRTLLLSATPFDLTGLWNAPSNESTILPSKSSHYPAVHNDKYVLNVVDDLNSITINENLSSLIMFNSVSLSQDFRGKILKESFLYHGDFEDKVKEDRLEYVYQLYGKQSNRFIEKRNIISTHALQASLDISVLNLFESCISPQSTLQRLPRCNRWGDYNTPSIFTAFQIQDKSENIMKSRLYNKDLSQKWFKYLIPYHNTKITQNEFYHLYNTFSIENSNEITKWVKEVYKSSLKSFSALYPNKIEIEIENEIDDGVITAGSNKLRASGFDEIFIIVQKSDLKGIDINEWSEPFTESIYDEYGYDSKFDEIGINIVHKQKQEMKRIMDSGRYPLLNYTKLMDNKKVGSDEIRKNAKKSNTPYIVLNHVLHPDFGLIKREKLYKLLN